MIILNVHIAENGKLMIPCEFCGMESCVKCKLPIILVGPYQDVTSVRTANKYTAPNVVIHLMFVRKMLILCANNKSIHAYCIADRKRSSGKLKQYIFFIIWKDE